MATIRSTHSTRTARRPGTSSHRPTALPRTSGWAAGTLTLTLGLTLALGLTLGLTLTLTLTLTRQHCARLPEGLQPGGEVELTLAYKPSSGLTTRCKLLGLYRAS